MSWPRPFCRFILDGLRRTQSFAQHGVSFCNVIAFVLPSAARGAQPIINVRLGPPEQPLPQIASQIQRLEGARATVEDEGRLSVGKAFASAKHSLEGRISKVVESAFGSVSVPPREHVQATSMLSSGASGRDETHVADTNAVLVKVFPMPAPDAAIKNKVAAIDGKLSHAEAHLFNQAASEMEALVDIFANEVQAQLKLHMRASQSGKGGAAVFFAGHAR